MDVVCIVGKPNTGKSSLFNRLIHERKAIISDMPGVTRDRLYARCTYQDKVFSLIDTGGIDLENQTFNENIKMQAEIGINEADIILFVVDGREDLTSNDFAINDMLRKSKKRVILVVNKIDAPSLDDNIYNYYELGIEEMISISVENKRNIDKLLDLITMDMDEYRKEIKDEVCRFSIIGRPNVGKSSLVNAILNEENRHIVSNIAGTTRDSNDSEFTYEKKKYVVVDTAGMRKKGKIYENIEKYSLIRSLEAIEKSDVCVVVIDAEQGIIEHDKHIVEYALTAGKAIVLVVNKWDTVKDKDLKIKEWNKLIEHEFQFIPYVKVVYLSALTKSRLHTLMPAIIKAYESYTKEIKTSVINDIIRDAVNLHQAPTHRTRRLKINFVRQTDICPPKFTFNVNDKNLIHFSYYRYLENKIRENIDFEGSPIILQFKNKNEDE